MCRRSLPSRRPCGGWRRSSPAGSATRSGISGGAFNPQVAIGGATAGLFAWSAIWVYILVELGAGVAAGLAFLALNPGDK